MPDDRPYRRCAIACRQQSATGVDEPASAPPLEIGASRWRVTAVIAARLDSAHGVAAGAVLEALADSVGMSIDEHIAYHHPRHPMTMSRPCRPRFASGVAHDDTGERLLMLRRQPGWLGRIVPYVFAMDGAMLPLARRPEAETCWMRRHPTLPLAPRARRRWWWPW